MTGWPHQDLAGSPSPISAGDQTWKKTKRFADLLKCPELRRYTAPERILWARSHIDTRSGLAPPRLPAAWRSGVSAPSAVLFRTIQLRARKRVQWPGKCGHAWPLWDFSAAAQTSSA